MYYYRTLVSTAFTIGGIRYIYLFYVSLEASFACLFKLCDDDAWFISEYLQKAPIFSALVGTGVLLGLTWQYDLIFGSVLKAHWLKMQRIL